MKNIFSPLLCLLVSLSIFSCSGKERILEIELPPTLVLEQNINFAVITSSHLRLRTEPSIKSKAITTLWRGYILEIVSRSPKMETVEGQENYWYQINYDGLQGWVFGSYLKVASSLEKAREEAARLQ